MGIQGLILLPTSSEYTSPKILELISKNFPIVVIDRLMANLPICSVQRIALLLQRIDKLSPLPNTVTRLAITSDSSVSTIDERVNGFLSAHVDANRAVSQKQILSRIDSVVPSSSRKIEDDVALIVAFLQRTRDHSSFYHRIQYCFTCQECDRTIGKAGPT